LDREALGRSRGGLSTKIHLAADARCRPVARVLSAGQRPDSIAFDAIMSDVRVARPGRGRRRTRPDRVLADKARPTRTGRSAAPCAAAASRRPSRTDLTSSPTALGGRVGNRSSTPRSTNSATSSSAPSTSPVRHAPSPHDTTNAHTSTPAPSTSPRSGSGYATRPKPIYGPGPSPRSRVPRRRTRRYRLSPGAVQGSRARATLLQARRSPNISDVLPLQYLLYTGCLRVTLYWRWSSSSARPLARPLRRSSDPPSSGRMITKPSAQGISRRSTTCTYAQSSSSVDANNASANDDRA